MYLLKKKQYLRTFTPTRKAIYKIAAAFTITQRYSSSTRAKKIKNFRTFVSQKIEKELQKNKMKNHCIKCLSIPSRNTTFKTRRVIFQTFCTKI